MKKLSICILVFSILCLLNVTNVFAVETSAKLKIDKTSVKPGDTVVVTIEANSDEGVSYVGTKINYDSKVLTLEKITPNAKWSNMGIDNQLDLFSNSTEKMTNVDVCTITFKVKEDIKDESTVISTSEFSISDILNKEYKASASQETIKIETEQTPDEPQKDEPKKDDTTADKKIDKAGLEFITIPGIALVTILAIVSYKKYKNIF